MFTRHTRLLKFGGDEDLSAHCHGRKKEMAILLTKHVSNHDFVHGLQAWHEAAVVKERQG